MPFHREGVNQNPLVVSPFHDNEYDGYPLPPPFPAFLLQEDFFLILQEDGFPILLE